MAQFFREIINFLKWWISLSLIGLSLYWGLLLFVLKFFSWPPLYSMIAVALITFGISFFLVKDEPASKSEEKVETFAGVAYLLLTKRKVFLALLVFGLLGTPIISYYALRSSTIEIKDKAITIKLPGEEVYYYPINPFGWQETGVRFEKDQMLKVQIYGKVSPGYMQSNAERQRYVKEAVQYSMGKRKYPPKPPVLADWPFSGPEGYMPDFYPEALKKGFYPYNDYRKDKGLTINGFQHNVVIGVIVGDGESLCYRLPGSQEPCTGASNTPGYNWNNPNDRERLIILSPLSGHEKYPIERSAPRSGYLWVTINDADEFRWDNSGLFFLVLRTKR